ncbi:MAG: DnaA N-terminal domain-containing protein, partial [Actinomycetota bacterium]
MAIASFEGAAERTWAHVVERARTELPESSFSMWFTGVRATALTDGVLDVRAPSEYVRDRLAKHYLQLIERAAGDATGTPVTVHLAADPEAPRPAPPVADRVEPPVLPAARPEPPRAPLGAPGLPFPNYTFETFVPGPSNRFAHA